MLFLRTPRADQTRFCNEMQEAGTQNCVLRVGFQPLFVPYTLCERKISVKWWGLRNPLFMLGL